MIVDVQHIDEIAIVRPKGKMTIGEVEVPLRHAIANLLAQGESKFLLELREVSTMDSSGAAAMVGALQMIWGSHGRVVLASVPAKVLGFLQFAQLTTVVKIVENLEQGLAHLRIDGQP